MVDSDRTIETLTLGELWSLVVAITLFTIFTLYGLFFFSEEDSRRFGLEWLYSSIFTLIFAGIFFVLPVIKAGLIIAEFGGIWNNFGWPF